MTTTGDKIRSCISVADDERYYVVMNPLEYKIIPDFISDTKGIVDVLANNPDQMSADINLTLLGSSTFDSAGLSEAIKNKTFKTGSHIVVRCGSHTLPFKILDYSDDGTAFCQSAIAFDKTMFSSICNDYETSDVSCLLSDMSRSSAFSDDFKDNHLVQRVMQTSQEDSGHKIFERFTLLDDRELFTYCPSCSSRVRYGIFRAGLKYNCKPVSYWLKSMCASRTCVYAVDHYGDVSPYNIRSEIYVVPACTLK